MWRLGVVDFDSSHCVEFTRRFNHVGVDRDQFVDGARVVAGWPGTSLMCPERIPGFLAEMRGIGVEIVNSWEELLGKMDAVLILSICGAAHLERVRGFLEAGIPAFVDKPFACSLADAQEMARLASEKGVVLMSSSGMRFADETLWLRNQRAQLGSLLGAVTYGPAKRAPGNPGLFHYGIHAVEALLEIMGPGCESVVTTWTEGAEVVTGHWADGRIGTVRGNRDGSTAYGYVAFCERGVINQGLSTRYSYRNLCQAIVQSLDARKAAVPLEASLEVVRFILAALQSEQNGGSAARLDHIT